MCVAVVADWNGDHVPRLADISVRKNTVAITILTLFQLRLHDDGHLWAAAPVTLETVAALGDGQITSQTHGGAEELR